MAFLRAKARGWEMHEQVVCHAERDVSLRAIDGLYWTTGKTILKTREVCQVRALNPDANTRLRSTAIGDHSTTFPFLCISRIRGLTL